MKSHKPNKCKIALIGHNSSATLFAALQIAYGLTGSWGKIILVGSSPNDSSFQHIGQYSTLHVPHDATPQHYMDILNIVGSCGKEAIILSSLSTEWEKGVNLHIPNTYYEEVLRSHNTLMGVLRHHPRHIIGCIKTKRSIVRMNTEGLPTLDLSQQVVFQPGFERNFTTVLKLDRKGRATVRKDLSQTLPTQQPFYTTYQTGAMLQDWCRGGKQYVPEDLKIKINECNSLSSLYQLLFDMDVDDVELISEFTRRRLELESEYDKSNLDVLHGGLK